MARERRPGETGDLGDRGGFGPAGPRGVDGALGALLRARRFRLGAGSERVAGNLRAFGGESAPDAAPFVGAARPPAEAPSVALGDHPGTLGPRSFGFLNNVGAVAALDAPLPALPRKGGLALLVPTREALPDLGPLALARGFGISWIISVGDGDPAEALAFLGADPATTALAVVLGAGASGATLRPVLGVKPTVVWGGDAICRAVARRAGAEVAGSIDEWLASAALLDAGVEPGARVEVIVVGGGRGFVAAEVEAAGLDAKVVAVDERIPAELDAAVRSAHASDHPVVLVAGGPPIAPVQAVPAADREPDPRHVLSADLRHPEHLRALLRALALKPAARDDDARPRVDKTLRDKVRAEVDRELTDHDAKRLLKAYGARVTRQAPTNTPTGAVKLAKTIGLPVLVCAGDEERSCDTLPEVRRIATLLLQNQGELPQLIVRERFSEVPRTRARVIAERGLGLTLHLGPKEDEACALLPLTQKDGAMLAASTPARRAVDQRAVAELLAKLSACAIGEDALFELELYVGADPAVLKASGSLRR